MNDSAPSPEIDLSWRMREQETRQLATLFRTSRLTLLSAEPGLDRTGLLTGGLLPLLRRRAADAVGDEDRESRVVVPFTDRRTRRSGRALIRVAERVVWFDAWGGSPVLGLRQAVLASLPSDAATYARSSRLAPMLSELARRFDARFLIVLDGFERFWHPALSLEAAEIFIDEFSEAVNLDDLRANFLLSIDDLAEPRLDALRRRIAGFDDASLHLMRWQSVTRVVPTAQESSREAPKPLVPAAEVAGAGLAGPAEPANASALPVLHDALPRPAPASPAPAPRSSAPRKPRRPRPPRVPFVKPAPIDTEGVYAFIESTLSQTASDFAPWRGGEEAPAPTPAPRDPGASRRPPGSGVRRAGLDNSSGKVRRPSASGHPIDMTNSVLEPPSPIDKWLDSAFAWLRRRLPGK